MTLHKVAVLVAPRPTLFEIGVVHEVFGIDRREDGVPPFEFGLCADRPDTNVEIDKGVSLRIPHGLDFADDADLVVATAYDYAEPPSAEMVATLRRAHDRGATVMSLCIGAFMLGEAGLLDDRRCTTHWRHADELVQRFPTATMDPDVLHVEDDRVITSAGTAAAIDACLHVVRCELGANVASAIARRMVVPTQREGGQRQFVTQPLPASGTGSLTPLLEWMADHLTEEQSITTLAKRAAMSERTFARRFAAETGTTPGKWLLAQRLHRARQLLETSDLPVETVAHRSGFGSAALLRHHFVGSVGVSPAEYRRTFRAS